MSATLLAPSLRLTEGQQQTFDAIVNDDFVLEHKRAAISGPAGTGKTVLISQIVKALGDEGFQVAVAAPTHKAASVLQDKFQTYGVQLAVPIPGGSRKAVNDGYSDNAIHEVRTIHSLLGLKPKRIIPGQPEDFDRTPFGSKALTHVNVLVVDECSMIGTKLFEYMIEAVETYSMSLLCVGDPHQLQPVNEFKKSKTFSVGEFYELDEVVRHDGAILKVATAIRSRRNFIPQFVDTTSGDSRIQTYNTEDDLKGAWLDELEADPEANIQMVCWKNDNRRAMNRAARVRLHGEDVPEFLQGDTIVALSHHICNKRATTYNEFVQPPLLANNEYTRIVELEFVPDYQPCYIDHQNGKVIHVPLDYTYAAWLITDDKERRYAVLSESSAAQYKKDLSAVSKSIKADLKALDKRVAGGEYCNPATVKRRWATEYFPLKEAFADVDFGYCCTIHKSQGSTFKQVFIWPDYEQCHREKSQLLYVAVTRASSAVHHIYTGLNR